MGKKITAPLYHKYPGQFEEQPAFVEMDEDGVVRADWNGEIGNAIPFSVYHGVQMRWSISPLISGAVLDELLTEGSELRLLLADVHAGHTVEWDGSNHVGRLTDSAKDASILAEWHLDAVAANPDNLAQVWDAADYLQAVEHVTSGGIAIGDDWLVTAETSEEALEVLCCEIEEAAQADGVLLTGLSEHLQDLQQRAREEAEEAEE